MAFATVPILSDACSLQDICTDGEELAMGGITLVWALGLGAILLFGWRGQLPGARGKPTSSERTDEG
jgi:hypothetical protein